MQSDTTNLEELVHEMLSNHSVDFTVDRIILVKYVFQGENVNSFIHLIAEGDNDCIEIRKKNLEDIQVLNCEKEKVERLLNHFSSRPTIPIPQSYADYDYLDLYIVSNQELMMKRFYSLAAPDFEIIKQISPDGALIPSRSKE
ncbi:MAG: hypothetical protein WEC59_10360 [Salibacteraceae bacterium]